jgi:3-oxochol-4-en-24-oyl-CoA dehydrogenase
LNSPGIVIDPIFTFQDERTNTTFYADVRVPDRYRVGEINGGVAVMSTALEIEQGSGGTYLTAHRKLLATAVSWARNTTRDQRPVTEDRAALRRLAAVATHIEVADVLFRRSLWNAAQGSSGLPHGPMSKVYSTEHFLNDATDLLDLAAPHSVLRSDPATRFIEQCHRHATATTIYGGTSEVLRSLIAEKILGLPRSRL